MIRGKWKWLLILLAALAVLVGLMALETLLGSVRKCGCAPAALFAEEGFYGQKREASGTGPTGGGRPGLCSLDAVAPVLGGSVRF